MKHKKSALKSIQNLWISNKKSKLHLLVIAFSVLVFGLFTWQVGQLIIAETAGSSPNSNVASNIRTVSSSIEGVTFGTTGAVVGVGDLGTKWNQIYSAAVWVPSGDALPGDVKATKTFYSNSRTKQTGQTTLVPTPTLGPTPVVGDNSWLNKLYKDVFNLRYGSEAAGAWGSWGTMLNRVYSSAAWSPSSDANAGITDVLTGKTFYSWNARTRLTGTSLPDANTSVCTIPSECFSGTCSTFYADGDGDTYAGNITTAKRCGASSAPAGYYSTATDCNDASNLVFATGSGYTDADSDTYTSGASTYTCFNNSNVALATKAAVGTGTPVTITAGMVRAAASATADCNDSGTSSANVYISAACYPDADNDDYGYGTQTTCSNNANCLLATWTSGGAGTTATTGNFSATTNDCGKDVFAAKPSQTIGSSSAFTNSANTLSYDWNCSTNGGAGTLYGTTYYTTVYVNAYHGCGKINCCPTATAEVGSAVGCGVGGNTLGAWIGTPGDPLCYPPNEFYPVPAAGYAPGTPGNQACL